MSRLRDFYERIGDAGEDLLSDILKPLGPVERGHRADVRWRGVEIEVKTARYRPYSGDHRGYQFCLRKDGHTDVGNADVACLICLPGYPRMQSAIFFFIPVDQLACRHLVIPGHPWGYSGRWAPYLDRWDILEEIAGRKEALCATKC